MQKNFTHTPVLLYEAVNSLNIRNDGIYIDGTFGQGGHSRLILSQLRERGRLFAIDRDPQAISAAATISDPRFTIIHSTFSSLIYYINTLGLIGKIDGILIDLGVSSLQLDDARRGFSFTHNGPLDMRMDPTHGLTAAAWLQQAKENDIASVLRMYGEERFSKRIAHAIVTRNRLKPITHTKELADIIVAAMPPIKNKFKHPATRSFQAIRIQINHELEEIKQVLKSALVALAPCGRLAVISFHSLEDRLVKRFIRNQSCRAQVLARLPITEAQLREYCSCQLKALGKIKPSKAEVTKNPRARSAILRIAERI